MYIRPITSFLSSKQLEFTILLFLFLQNMIDNETHFQIKAFIKLSVLFILDANYISFISFLEIAEDYLSKVKVIIFTGKKS